MLTSLLRLTCCAVLLAMLPGIGLSIEYPDTPRGDTVDSYHGVDVPDPYRWMEDIGSPEVADWVARQNELSLGYLSQIEGRDRLLHRFKSMLEYRRWSSPAEEGGRYFFSRNDGLQNHSPLFVSDSLDSEGVKMLDPNEWSADGSMSLASWEPSRDGKLLLYARSDSGSDWAEFMVRDIESGQDLPDRIKWAKFAMGAWAKDASGFWYMRFDPPVEGNDFTGANLNPTVMWHQLGTDQSADVHVYSLPEHPDWWVSFGLNEEQDLMTIYISEPGSINNRFYLKRLSEPGQPLVKLLDLNDAGYSFVGNEGKRLWFTTDLNAPNGRLVEIDLENPAPEHWRTLIPESRDTLNGVSAVAGVLFANYSRDTRTVIRKYTTDGTYLLDVALPGFGSAGGFGGRKEDTETFFTYIDMTTPSTVYRYDLATDAVEVWRAPAFPYDTSQYESRLLFYRSFDGVAVPIYVMHRKGLELDGDNPTILYGYGGFGGGISPYFSGSRLTWLDMGGVYVVAGIRGGDEYGKSWHESAIKQGRQVSFSDFISAAEYLIDAGYTNSDKLAIMGGSNGGLLVGAVMLQRPDLFAVVVPQVPVADMLRFNQFTSGKGWESDYGSPQVAEEFEALLAYSPYHRAEDGGCYPATLITTADTDDRVVPFHSFKLAAALQHGQSCPEPILLRVETAAGHGAGKPLDKVLEEIADIYGFILISMGESIPVDL